jgi:hypothetical protein
VKRFVSPPLIKNRGPLDLKYPPTLEAFSGMLQLLCTHDPQLSQGLTVDEKRASMHDTEVNRTFEQLFDALSANMT